jgi:hypothetical protein
MNRSKNAFAVLAFVCMGICYAQSVSEYELTALIAGINSVGPPVVKGNYAIFTAEGSSRYAGIAFDFENFSIVHAMQRIEKQDIDYRVIDSLLFYVLEIPKYIDSIAYKLVIDGMWTMDPVNPDTIYVPTAGRLSALKIPQGDAVTTKTASGKTRFVYRGESGQRIRLSASFTNWDPFIYELKESSPGIYELEIPLPKGTYYYKFLRGITEFIDTANPARVFSGDGQSASVFTVD